MKVQYKHFPEDIQAKYHLDNKVTESGHIYIKIKKGMYGLKQAVILAYKQLEKMWQNMNTLQSRVQLDYGNITRAQQNVVSSLTTLA